jgi:hypothetical protein
MTEFVTMPQPVVLGTGGLFAVQAGVPLSEAMDALGVLLDTAEAATLGAAEAVGGGQDCSGAVWAVQHLLQMARALNSSIQSGFVAAQRGNDASGRA